MAAEHAFGHAPKDVSTERIDYDTESREDGTGARLPFIKVKGRAEGADTVTVTRNEVLPCSTSRMPSSSLPSR